jgi:hypothetical protein
MTDIFDIKQLDENRWQAKYHGNYGIYTIKMTLDKNGKAQNFSCTCPSDYYPCKHIGYVQSAILNHIKTKTSKQSSASPTVSDVLQNVSLDELRAFVIKKATYDNELTNNIMLEFAGKIIKTKIVEYEDEEEYEDENPYSSIICNALSNIDGYPDKSHSYYDDGDYYIDLSILEEWLQKAKDFESQEKFEKAILICKACIEEYAQWTVDNQGGYYEVENFIAEDYMTDFFTLLKRVANSGKIDKKLLYEYCQTEIAKEKYKGTDIFNEFNDLMANAAADVNPDEFIAFQNALLKKVTDKSSYEAKKILERIICAYRTNNQTEKAEKIIEKNLQIEAFCRQTVEKRISEKNYDEAKKLINNSLENTNRNPTTWKELLLTIAQEENNTVEIRKITMDFLAHRFNNKYFKIYKSTFQPEEWTQAFEELYRIYNNAKKTYYYNENLTELLRAENLTEKLIDYIESNLSINILEKYYDSFFEKYPQKTLTFFHKVVNEYAEQNLGRKHYEYVKELLQKMLRIKGGNTMVAEMVSQFKTKYKNRRAMIDILNSMK